MNGSRKIKRIPIEDFFRNSMQTAYKLSPSGEFISYMAPYKERMNVFVSARKGGGAIRVTNETERSVAGYMWANNHTILFLKDNQGDENYQLYGVEYDGSNQRAFTAIPGVRTTIIDDLPDIDDQVIIGTNQRNPEIFDPYRLNLDTGELTLIAQNPGNIQEWITDHNGELRIAVAIVDGVNTQILYRKSETEEFTPVITTNFKEEINLVAFTPDNLYVYAITNLGRDKSQLVIMNPETCQEIKTIYWNDQYDISGVNYSRVKGKLTHAAYIGHKKTERFFFDNDTEIMYNRLGQQLEKYQYGIASSNRAEDVFLIAASNDRCPGVYFLYDSDSNKLTKIAEVKPWIKSDDMADMIPVLYTSRDGLKIEAYLTLPAGLTMEKACNLPVIINPHGGPWARDTWGYNSEAQFFANRGYALFQMNFRGSTGFGRSFLESSYKQWGQTMQDDITDGVLWLIDKGIADPARIAIYGGSYGGYATLSGLTKTPELYACGVDYVGVSNLFTFMKTIPPYWKPMLEMLYEQVGDPIKDKEMLRENSPVFNAHKIKAPLLIAQGSNDPRVNKAESDQMVKALKARGIKVEYIVKENEGHGFSNQENRFDLYRAMENFFETYL
ncbi:MAG TPA: S9 family peptidase [Bacteroidaceae bacterium]|nr:S9 family peptidase [Bacteroidaceae bacterium]